MKRSLGLGLVALATLVIVPVAKGSPSLAQLQNIGTDIVQQVVRPEVKLELKAAKQVQTLGAQGKTQLSWQPLEGEATVQPLDVLRYTISSANAGEMAAKNLVISQAIPPQMTYVLATARGNDGVEITYSIDGGESFVAEPQVEVVQEDGTVTLEPAPAEAYTDIRWDFAQSLEPQVVVQVAYDLTVN
ncbi:DUF11 domain-containing protein [Nodosilinea sp. LEGE 07088]|uniref:DUF11 domain-containing protein n=1 Tax=Nodosilinea sp. LEGE 07088 TaxID=2777968 RepID=UPI00187FD18D|nr:DUF11 domain-containing protein [Nodosilinea sp. LEGE 07088]MBE9137917.1 DUF11 domain-containing protein [Nodosilinea sp. LEGE 07088]